MAVKLRLMRVGKRKQPSFRLVAADSHKARNGRIIENLGTYDPRQEPSLIEIDNEKAVSWLRKGAQPTERVEKLLRITGAWETFTGEAGPASHPPPPAEKAAPEPEAEATTGAEEAEADDDDAAGEAKPEADDADAGGDAAAEAKAEADDAAGDDQGSDES